MDRAAEMTTTSKPILRVQHIVFKREGALSAEIRERYSLMPVMDAGALVQVEENTPCQQNPFGSALGNILLYIDERDFSDGLRTLLAVSAVSRVWRATANRLPQWSLLVRAHRLPCPSFDRAGFQGTRNAVFRPLLHAKERSERWDMFGLGVLLFMAIFSASPCTSVLSIRDELDFPHQGDASSRASGYEMRMSRTDGGTPGICHMDKTCVSLQQLFQMNGNATFISFSTVADALGFSPFSRTDGRPIPSLKWMCPTVPAFLDEWEAIAQLHISGLFITAVAVPLLGVSIIACLPTSRRTLRRFWAICTGVCILFVLLGWTLLLVAFKRLDALAGTPCAAGHPSIDDLCCPDEYRGEPQDGGFARNRALMISILCLAAFVVVVGILMIIRAVFFLKLWAPLTTPEDREIHPDSGDSELNTQLERFVEHATFIRKHRDFIEDFTRRDDGDMLKVAGKRVNGMDFTAMMLYIENGDRLDIGEGGRIYSDARFEKDRGGD